MSAPVTHLCRACAAAWTDGLKRTEPGATNFGPLYVQALYCPECGFCPRIGMWWTTETLEES